MKFTLKEAATKKLTVKTDIKAKDGSVLIPAGTKGTARPVKNSEMPNRTESDNEYSGVLGFRPEGSDKEFKLHMGKLATHFAGVAVPNIKTLEKWEWEKGGSKTPVGTWVEVDGWDPDGWPAWTLILGIV